MKTRQAPIMLLCAGTLMLTASCASMLNHNRDAVVVESSPPEANVIVDGVHHGTTPVSLNLRTYQHPPPRVSVIKEGYAPISVPLQKQLSPLTFLNVTNILGYGIDWATGSMFDLTPDTIAVRLGEQNEPEGPEEPEASESPEVVVGVGQRPWWIHSYGKIYGGYRVIRMVGNTLVVLNEGGTEEEVPLEDIYSISGAERPTPNMAVTTGILALVGGYFGAGVGFVTGAVISFLADPPDKSTELDSPEALFIPIGAGLLGAVLGGIHGTRLAPDPYGPPDIQTIMAEWTLAEKRGWIKNNVLR